MNQLPSIIWASVIAFLSLTAAKNLPQLDWELFTPDKVGHFSVYAILSILIIIPLPKQFKSYALGIFIASGYGTLMEWAQWFLTPDRCFDYMDMVANIIGSVLGATVLYTYHRFGRQL